jgi:hypothetical protein
MPGFRLRMIAEDKHQTLPSGFANMSQYIKTTAVWQREIKHDGFGMDGVEQALRLGDSGRLGDHPQTPRFGHQRA